MSSIILRYLTQKETRPQTTMDGFYVPAAYLLIIIFLLGSTHTGFSSHLDNKAVITVKGSGCTTPFESGAGIAHNTRVRVFSHPFENLFIAHAEIQEQTITFNPLAPATYGDPAITLAATSNSGLPVTFESDDPSVATVSGNLLTIVGAGTVNIIASQSGDAIYDPAVDVVQVFTVNKAPLSATADNKTKTYGDPNPVLTITYIGFKGSDNAGVIDTPPTLSTEVTQFSPVDSYEISFMSEGIDNNYTITPLTDGTLTIIKATVTASVDNKTKIYGDPNPVFTITYSGLKGSDNASVIDTPPLLTTEATQFSPADLYDISFISEGFDNDYEITSITDGTLTITKAPLSATADNKTKKYGDPNPVFTITYSGFKGSDNASMIDTPPLLGTDATPFSPVASYAITFISEGIDNDYDINALTDGTLTINKADQAINFEAIIGKTIFDDPFAIIATSTSGLPVSFTSSNPAILSISGTTATLHSSGTTIITASQAGGTNFNAADDVTQEVFINNKMYQSITFETIQLKTYGDEPFQLLATATSGLPINYSSSNTQVATIDGSLVTIIGVGSTTITARQSGNDMYEAAEEVDQELVVVKKDQLITFETIPDKTLGDPNFSISASSSSDLTISFEAVTPNITVDGNQVILLNAGTATIRATQPGDEKFNAAESVSQSFCINPARPTVTVTNNNGPEPTLTSSATIGNQWYLNGVLIPGATNSILTAVDPGVYTVKVKVETCESVASESVAIIITGDIQENFIDLTLRPNPVEDRLEVDFTGFKSGSIAVAFIDPLGRITESHEVQNKTVTFDLNHFAPGIYWIVATQSTFKITKQLIKK